MMVFQTWYIGLLLVLTLLAGTVGALVSHKLMHQPKPSFAVVDLQKLMQHQTAQLRDLDLTDIELQQKARDAALQTRKAVTTWSQTHNTIIFNKGQCLSDLPDVTADIQHQMDSKP